MQKTIPIFENLEDSVTIIVVKYEMVKGSNYNIAISPDIGAWSIIDLKDIDKLHYLSTSRTVSEINKSKWDYNEIAVFINNLFFSRLVLINGKLASIEKEREYPIVPHFWVLKYTNACNLKCLYCYSYDKKNTKRNDLPNELIYKISDLIDAQEKVEFCFHGGEPLIRYQDMANCVKELRKRRKDNLNFIIQTNGTLLTPTIAKFLKDENFSVGISIDGYDEESNKLRPFGNNHTSVHSTNKAIDICKEAGFIPAILSVMTLNNCDCAVKTIEYYAKKGVISFHFNHFIPSGRAERKEEIFSVPTDKLLTIRTEMLCFINDWNKERPIIDHIHERFTRNIIRSLINCQRIEYMCGQSPCGAGRRIMAIAPSGDIFPCDDFCGNEDFKIGNIKEISNLKDEVMNSCAVKLCQLHNIDNIKECNSCVWKRICISHCCSGSYNYYGRLNAPHSACEFIKRFIPIIIDLLYRDRIQIENLIN
jgi:uncharacterized protein